MRVNELSVEFEEIEIYWGSVEFGEVEICWGSKDGVDSMN